MTHNAPMQSLSIADWLSLYEALCSGLQFMIMMDLGDEMFQAILIR